VGDLSFHLALFVPNRSKSGVPTYFQLRWGWIFLERTQILSGIHFTRHFIELVLGETKQFVGSSVNVILTQQTCGQRSSRSTSAGSKRETLAFYVSIRMWLMFQISKCRGESHLNLCTTLVLAKRMRLHGGDFRQILRPNTFFNRNSPMRSRILFPSIEILHRPRSSCFLYFESRNIYQIRMKKRSASVQVCFLQTCSSADSMFSVSRSRLGRTVSFPQEPIRW